MSLPAQSIDRVQLTVEEIIHEAMELVKRDGIDRLTIRALAARLGVAPGAVYYYVESKEDLLQRIGEAIADAVPTAPPGPWPQRLRVRIKATVATFGRFPGSDALAGSAEPWRRTAVEPRPAAELLAEAGLPPEETAQAGCTLTLFIAGALRLAEISRRSGETEPFAESRELDGAVDTLIAGLRAQYGLA
jgi:AcrR family transcriptional regulator